MKAVKITTATMRLFEEFCAAKRAEGDAKAASRSAWAKAYRAHGGDEAATLENWEYQRAHDERVKASDRRAELERTTEQAAREWVETFNAIPIGIIEKLFAANPDEIMEVTPPTVGDRVYIYNGENTGEEGEIIGAADRDGEEAVYTVELDSGGKSYCTADKIEVQRDDVLPMWGTLWAFNDRTDNKWFEYGDGLQKMADCGFRIYEQEDYGYIFGIDGAGYSFFEAH